MCSRSASSCPAHETDRREGGAQMKQEESFINTVEALLSGACVCKAPAIELIRSGLQHTLITGANQPTAVRTESKGKTCTQRSGKGQMPRTDGNQPNPKPRSRSLSYGAAQNEGPTRQGHSWLVVSFVSEQKPSWQGFVTLTRDGSNSTQG